MSRPTNTASVRVALESLADAAGACFEEAATLAAQKIPRGSADCRRHVQAIAALSADAQALIEAMIVLVQPRNPQD